MRILKLAGRGGALFLASVVFWGIYGAVMGGGMLTPDEAVRHWVGRAALWNIIAILVTPAALDAIQSRRPLSGPIRFGGAFVLIALPFFAGLSVKPEVEGIDRLQLNWGMAGIIVNGALAAVAAYSSRPKIPETA